MIPLKYKALLCRAFSQYQEIMFGDGLTPEGEYLNYDFSFIENRKWHSLGEAMAKCEIRELTNLLNHWQGSLRHCK